MVDDNFIGNKRNVKLLLKELKIWQTEHQYPFRFNTEASVDLAERKKQEAQQTEVERKKLELEAESHRAKVARYKI